MVEKTGACTFGLICDAMIGSEGTSIDERVVDHDRVVALGAGGQQVHRCLDHFFDAADVFDRGCRQVGPAAGPLVLSLQPSMTS